MNEYMQEQNSLTFLNLLYLLFVLEFFDISVLLILPMSVLNVLFATIASA